MSYLFTILAIVFTFQQPALANQADSDRPTLKVGYVLYWPYAYQKDNQLQGTAINHVRKDYGDKYNLIFISIPIARVPNSLNKGIIDFFVTYIYDESRLSMVNYSKSQFYKVNPAACFRTDAAKITDEAELLAYLKKKKLIVPRGTPLYPSLRESKESFERVREITYKQGYTKRAVKMVQSGRYDVAFMPDLNKFSFNRKEFNNISCINLGNGVGIHFASAKNGPKVYEPLTPFLKPLK